MEGSSSFVSKPCDFVQPLAKDPESHSSPEAKDGLDSASTNSSDDYETCSSSQSTEEVQSDDGSRHVSQAPSPRRPPLSDLQEQRKSPKIARKRTTERSLSGNGHVKRNKKKERPASAPLPQIVRRADQLEACANPLEEGITEADGPRVSLDSDELFEAPAAVLTGQPIISHKSVHTLASAEDEFRQSVMKTNEYKELKAQFEELERSLRLQKGLNAHLKRQIWDLQVEKKRLTTAHQQTVEQLRKKEADYNELEKRFADTERGFRIQKGLSTELKLRVKELQEKIGISPVKTTSTGEQDCTTVDESFPVKTKEDSCSSGDLTSRGQESALVDEPFPTQANDNGGYPVIRIATTTDQDVGMATTADQGKTATTTDHSFNGTVTEDKQDVEAETTVNQDKTATATDKDDETTNTEEQETTTATTDQDNTATTTHEDVSAARSVNEGTTAATTDQDNTATTTLKDVSIGRSVDENTKAATTDQENAVTTTHEDVSTARSVDDNTTTATTAQDSKVTKTDQDINGAVKSNGQDAGAATAVSESQDVTATINDQDRTITKPSTGQDPTATTANQDVAPCDQYLSLEEFDRPRLKLAQTLKIGTRKVLSEWQTVTQLPVELRGRCFMEVLGDQLVLGSASEGSDGHWVPVLFYTSNLREWNRLEPPPHTDYTYALFQHGEALYGVFSTPHRIDRDQPCRIFKLQDLVTGLWERLPNGRFWHKQFSFATAVLDGCVHFMGGWDLDTYKTFGAVNVSVFHLDHHVWLKRTHVKGQLLPVFCRAVVCQQKMLLVGGATGGGLFGEQWTASQKVIDFLSVAEDGHNDTVLLDTPKGWCGACSVDNYLVVAGGGPLSRLSADVYMYDFASRQWLALPKMSHAGENPCLVLFGDQLVCVGGSYKLYRVHNTVEALQLSSQT